MKFKCFGLTNAKGYDESLSNLVFKSGRCDVTKIADAIEDSKNCAELCATLKGIIYNEFRVVRETDDYIRLLSIDPLGNKTYLTIEKCKGEYPTVEQILCWIAEHDQLAKDFDRHFGTSIFQD